MRLFILIFAIFIAGCSDKPTPLALPVPSKPVIEVSAKAERILKLIATMQKFPEPWYVRLAIAWKAEPEITVKVERTPPGPDDMTYETGDLKCVIARELLPYLRGCHVDLFEAKDSASFDVTFPNQDDYERERASKWLRDEKAKRAAKQP